MSTKKNQHVLRLQPLPPRSLPDDRRQKKKARPVGRAFSVLLSELRAGGGERVWQLRDDYASRRRSHQHQLA
ncbi:MAG TPA: hypothetical protein VN797_03230, partial [Gemmatimonadaceae bacterium]|nr:hypothetical protein [Gemmatimonadaceae bacterium]